MSRKRYALLMIYALCFAIVFLAGRGWQNHRIREWDAAATQVCALLCGHDFDGVEMDVAGKKIALYERVAQDPFASVLTRRSVATVACTAGEMEIVQNFRDIRSFQGGIFFAVQIDWDGEWTGVYISSEDLPAALVEYAMPLKRRGHYWLRAVSDAVLHEEMA